MSNGHNGHGTDYTETALHEHGTPHMPDPSIMPLILAIGMTLLPLGLLLGLTVLIPGVIIFAIGLGGWLIEDTRTHMKQRREGHH